MTIYGLFNTEQFQFRFGRALKTTSSWEQLTPPSVHNRLNKFIHVTIQNCDALAHSLQCLLMFFACHMSCVLSLLFPPSPGGDNCSEAGITGILLAQAWQKGSGSYDVITATQRLAAVVMLRKLEVPFGHIS